MSEPVNPPSGAQAVSAKLPDGIAGAILGLALGAGLMFLVAQFYFGPKKAEAISIFEDGMPALPGGPPKQPPPAADSTAAESSTRRLIGLVRQLEFLSREADRSHLEFDADQRAKISAQLSDLKLAGDLTEEDAKERLQAIEKLLAPRQNETIAAARESFEPFKGNDTGSGDGAGAAAPGKTPFAQEANENRLEDLLKRLGSAN